MQPRIALKLAFLRRGISQRAVSFDARIPETRLSAIVRGRVSPMPQERAALASLLGTSEHELFTDDAEAEAVPA